MDGQARAGIDLYGATLRYAEVEQHGERYHLLRLGSCDFDFDVTAAMLDGTNTDALEALTDALSDIFQGSAASRLHVTLHPPHGYSFFTPLPVEMAKEERKQRLLGEAALLTRLNAQQPLRLTADPLYTETLEGGQGVEWYHVLALKERLHARFDRIFRMLPQSRYRMTLSMHAVAHAIERIQRQRGGDGHRRPSLVVAVGWYPTHVEYTLCRDGHWYFSHFTEAGAPEDCAYYILVLLERLGLTPASLEHLFLYGGYKSLGDFMSLEDVFFLAPERLNPMDLLEVDAHDIAAGQHFEAYVPCIGVVL